MPATPRFIRQADPGVCTIETAAVRQAAWTCDDIIAEVCAKLADVELYAFGANRGQRDLCPVGSVEFCRAWMRAVGASEPAPIDYPEVLQAALGRPVTKLRYSLADIGGWIKPVRTKAWESHVKRSVAEHAPNELVWMSTAVPPECWLAEWRVYVMDGQVVGVGRYDDHAGEDLSFDGNLVRDWVARWQATGQAPRGYALDVARWPDRTVLVEVTDGWAIGLYKGSCSPANYARLLAARWTQITQNSL